MDISEISDDDIHSAEKIEANLNLGNENIFPLHGLFLYLLTFYNISRTLCKSNCIYFTTPHFVVEIIVVVDICY